MSKLWHIATKDEIEDNLNTDFERGMTNEFAQSKLNRRIRGSKPIAENVPKAALSYFSTVMAALLVILSVIFMFKDPVLGTTVVVLVLISEILGFAQDIVSYKTEHKIKKILKPKAVVIRDGKQKNIQRDEIVEGDIVVLSKGDVVPCDGRITYCENLEVDQKCVTGISENVAKSEDAELSEDTQIKDQSNMLFAGSVVVSGNCRIVACRTGENTVLATLDDGTSVALEKSYMQDKLCEVSKVLSCFTFILLAVILLIGILSGTDMYNTAMLCLALGAVLVPSKLPAVISCVVNKGMLKMAQHGSIVKNQATLEKLALCDVVITGKTGIVTQSSASVFGVISTQGSLELKDDSLGVPQKSILRIILEFASVCTQPAEDKSISEEQAVDKAVLNAAKQLGADVNKVEIAKRFLLDMNKKAMTVCASVQDGYRIISKGDVNEVIKHCTHAVSSTSINEMTDELKEDLIKQYKELSQNGFKAVAVAYKDSDVLTDEIEAEKDLVFLGIVVIENNVRDDSVEAINELVSAGIRPVMLTYDNAFLSEYIARQSGIMKDNDIVVTGDELLNMQDSELDEKIDNIAVFAELKPCDKVRIAQSLKRKGKTVCVISASSYDKDTLEIADISASEKDGAEVNEFKSDVVTDGTLLGLVNAMKKAQMIYLDARKSIRFMVSNAAAQMLFVLFAMLLTSSLPLVATQVLVIGILTTGFIPFVLPFGGDWDKHKLKNVKQNNSIFLKMWPRILSTGVLLALLALVVFIRTNYFVSAQSDLAAYTRAQTTVFLFFVLYAVFGAIYLRKNAITLKEGKTELVCLAVFAVGCLAAVVLLLTIPILKNLFGFGDVSTFFAIIFALIPLAVKALEDVLKNISLRAKKTEAINGTDI
ncbi:MAG: cation-transporting P-type ATPase [Clostridia bacterium]|nr:cation-transporting P-type ATPase [Clostridia bacterium]